MTPQPSSSPLSGASPAEWLASRPACEQQAFLSSLTREERAALSYTWRGWNARPKQLAPLGTEWVIWLLCAGRGFGKSRTGAEWIREKVGPPNVPSKIRIAIAGRTAAEVRKVMIDGESGLLSVFPPWNRPKWNRSAREILWPNGARATTLSADKPDQFRGPQYHFAWCDEVASWRYPEAFDQLRLGNRLPDVVPQICVSTTPRPTDLIRSILSDPLTRTTRGSSFENLPNLAPSWIASIRRKYEGTRLGRQELYAEVLDDTIGALWSRAVLERAYARTAPRPLKRVVVAIDPSVTSAEESDETGMLVCGLDERDEGWLLEDLSGRFSPNTWAKRAVRAYHRWSADCIVAEVNNGGDLVESTIRTVDESVAYRAVRAAKGKYTRAEPVAALYEQGRVHHVGVLDALEQQMCTWIPGASKKSPDRVDAAVWGLTELMLGEGLQLGDLDTITAGTKPRRFASASHGDSDWDE